jgi:hypothetical protein
MISIDGGRSPTTLDLLFGPGADAPVTLARAVMSADGALPLTSLPAVTREAAVREAATVAAGLLHVDLIGVLVAGWREHRDIISAAQRTLARPGSIELVSLVTHQVTVTRDPSVSVLVDGGQVATLRLGLSIVSDVHALLAEISGGYLVKLHSGRCDMTATLAVQGTDLLARRAHLELRGIVSVGRGIRILPAAKYLTDYPGTEYPVGRHRASKRPAGESRAAGVLAGRNDPSVASAPW